MVLLRRAQRTMAQRASRAYRTVSYEAVCLMSGSLPWDLEAGVLAEVYRRRALMRQRGEEPLPEEIVRWRKEGRDDLFRRWKERLADATLWGLSRVPSATIARPATWTAEHTLAVCTGWDAQRATLTGAIGRDLSLPAVIHAMVGSEQSWAAVASFAREVMAAKREALRERERANETLPPRRAPAKGRRLETYAAAL
ncbi:PREDICTED: uncharacterized protein LOC106120939 [Papilio xuthus]|uniref:Uncharacterized protein LOC106120939 n=1 Tax=Papilio xuthus TaxID=66420 RepID=A0AAJ6ZFY4_PAPXU|nr:PREDICTED: uncharacterized protein LOC106120939 [Papilio xuthus]